MPGGLTDAMAGLGIAGGPGEAADIRQPGISTPTTTPELKNVIMNLIRETLESEKMLSPNFGHENFRDIPLVGPIYSFHFSGYKVRYMQKQVKDITEKDYQDDIT